MNIGQATTWADTSVKQLALSHVKRLRGKREKLRSIVDTLKNLADLCGGDSRAECPILAELQGSK